MARHWRFALVLFCLAVAGLLALQVVLHGPMLELDQDVSAWWGAHRHPWLTATMLLVSGLHQTTGPLLATAVLMAWAGLRHDRAALRALLVVPAAMLLNVALKESFRRARPVFDDPLVQLATYSFPSGHAAASTAFYGMACALVFAHTRSRRRRAMAATVAMAMVLLVCFSRVYLGAHFVSDVIAGVAEGTVCVLLFTRLFLPPPRGEGWGGARGAHDGRAPIPTFPQRGKEQDPEAMNDTAPILIRAALGEDADTIAAFNAAMAWETEHKRLLPAVLGAGVRRLLAEPALGFYLVAEVGGQAVGCLMVTTEWSDWRNGRFWWIQSVYVAPAWRRRGVFRALYACVHAAAVAQPDVCGLRLYVERDNAVAQATYRSLGMAATDYLLFEQLQAGITWLQPAGDQPSSSG